MERVVVRVDRLALQVQVGTVPSGTGGGGAVASVDGRTGVVVLSDLYQPLDSDLTAIAALTTTAFGRALLELANAAAGRTALGAEASGTAAAAVAAHEAAGDPHPGYLTEAAAAAAYQPLDSDLTAIAALTTTAFGRALLELANAGAGRTALDAEQAGTAAAAVAAHEAAGDPHPGYLTEAAAAAAYQPLDGDLTAIAALTTTAFGRALLELANAGAGRTALDAEQAGTAAAAVAAHEAAGDPHPGYLTEAAAAAAYQPLDSDLTAIAALTTTAFGRALLALADAAAGRAALAALGGTQGTDNAAARWDGASGLLLQDSPLAIADSGNLTVTGTGTGSEVAVIAASAVGWSLRGNRAAGSASPDVILRGQNTRTAGTPLVDVQNNATTALRVRADGAILPSLAAIASGTAQAIVTGGVNHTGQTASTEVPYWHAATHTRTWATGAIATQREIRFDAPTYAAAGASTITDAATLYVGGAPIAGSNVTITNGYALWVDAGVSRFDGDVWVSNTGLQVYDTDGSHRLSIVPGSDLTAARTLTLTTGDVSRILSFTGSTGAVYYTDASGNLVALAPGTDGDVLTTHGAAAPTWETPSGGGGGLTHAQVLGRAALRL